MRSTNAAVSRWLPLTGITASVAVVIGTLFALPAGAVAPRPVILHQAWASTGQPAQVSPQPDTVYAAAAVGRERSRTFLQLNLAGIPQASLAKSAVELTPTGTPLPDAQQVALQACLLEEPLTKDGDITADPPLAENCTVQAPVEVQAGRWRFSVAVFANHLRSGALGLTLRPTLLAATTFQIAFDTTRTSFLPSLRADLKGVGTTRPVPTPPTELRPAATGTADGGKGSEAPVGFVLNAGIPSGELSIMGPATTPQVESPVVADVVDTTATVALAGLRRAAPHSSSGWPAALVALVVAGCGLLLRRQVATLSGELPRSTPGGAGNRSLVAGAATLVGLLIVGSLGGEAFTFKIGICAIIFVAAIGLHVLVNATGELSLAHAALVGLPAFLLAQISSHTGISPIYLLPVGLVLGALLGTLVGLPALRSRGLQVALVTLAVAFAIERFLFRQPWVIGPPSGMVIPEPSFLGLSFASNRALLPVLATVVALAVMAAGALLRSRLGRAFAFVRSSPDAAAAVGISIARYRLLAFGVAGSFAGLAGALYVVWVQRVSAPTFSITHSFFYLVVVVLAGRGGLGGLAVSTALLSGGQLFLSRFGAFFDYAGPITLIANLALYRKGLNGALGDISLRWAKRPPRPAKGPAMSQDRAFVRLAVPSLGLITGLALMAAGFAAIALAWYHSGNTSSAFVQNQELVSGGIGGLALVVAGATLLLRDALLNGRTIQAMGPADQLAQPAPPPELADLQVPDDLSALEPRPEAAVRTRQPRSRPAAKT